MTTYIVLTTINMPSLLNEYADNFKRYGHHGEAGFIVVGDLKTPPEVAGLMSDLTRRGFEALYLDVAAQKKWLKGFPKLEKIIPYNSDNRRNIGYLVAAQRGADRIICIDDDNFVGEDDFLAGHNITGLTQKLPQVSSSNGWFNICSMMDTAPPSVIYPRGYPYSQRNQDGIHSVETVAGRVAINAGLWFEDPDVDAVSRLNGRVRTISINRPRLTLAPGTWSPINTQNTCFHRDVLPCFYYVEMGASIKGMAIDRYGDIWAGYLARKVIDAVGDKVAFGPPAAIHKRNQHNLLKDLQQELWGMIFTEKLVEILRSITLTGKGYSSLYVELATALEKDVRDNNKHYEPEMCSLFLKIADNMKIWVDACESIS